MVKILHFNRDEELVGTLKELHEPKIIEELNGLYSLTLSSPYPINKMDRLLYHNRFGKWQEFVVSNVVVGREGDLLLYEIYADHSSVELTTTIIEDLSDANTSATTALTMALSTSRWLVGTVDVPETHPIHFYHITGKESLNLILDTWDCDVEYEILVDGNSITRKVNLHKRRGHYLNRRFTYRKNMEKIAKEVNEDQVITALYGFGKGDEIVDGFKQYTRRLDFKSINDGKAYVENLDARDIWGFGQNGGKRHVFGLVNFDDIENRQELKDTTEILLELLSTPSISYEATILDFAIFDDRYRPLGIGDTVRVIDLEFRPELRLEARVIAIEEDLHNPENTVITLGNYVPTLTTILENQMNYISNFRDKSSIWDRANYIDPNGNISMPPEIGDKLDDLEARVKALEEE